MRDLEKQIADWRRAMSNAADSREELLDELEEHLREEINRLIRSGISADNVFEMAVSKFGRPSAVAAEFAKLSAHQPIWLPIRIARLCFALAALAALLAYGLIGIGRGGGLLLGMHAACVTFGYLIVFLIGALGICYVGAQWFDQSDSARGHSLRRSTVQFANVSLVFTAVGVILGMLWAREHMGRYWAWDAKETGGGLVFFWAALLSALRWGNPGQTTVAVMAILGNVVTFWAWFGTSNSSSWLASNSFLVAFAASHLLVILAGIVNRMTRLRREQVR